MIIAFVAGIITGLWLLIVSLYIVTCKASKYVDHMKAELEHMKEA